MHHTAPMPFALQASDYQLPAALSLTVAAHTGSTNTDLLEFARAGALADGDAGHATVRIAHVQQTGRGRLGRTWHAQAGASLLMSVGCTRRVTAHDLRGITVALGTRAALVLRAHGVNAEVKWPNDLLLHGAKLAGILVETVATPAALAVVAGIGVNGVLDAQLRSSLDQPVAALTDSIALPPTQAAQIGHDLAMTFAQLLWAPDLRAAITTELRNRHAGADACKNRAVQLLMDGQPAGEGIARGVDDEGHLLLETSQGVRRMATGEVSLRWQ